ncbi:MAG: hypothetical protein ABI266_04835 [Ginsengibacter sp.]
MTATTNKLENLPNKFTRSKFLRDTILSATGIVLLPSIFTGCKKIDHNPDYNLGNQSVWDAKLTNDDLKKAADNLNRMRKLLKDLYDIAFKYDEVVLEALGSTVENSSWRNFIVNILIDIAAAMASAAAIALDGPLAVPVIACLSAILHDWGIGKNLPDGINVLNGFFAGYQEGQIAMGKAIDEKLGFLTDENYPLNDYKNLRNEWTAPIVFNGKSYTLADLVNSYFPEEEDNSVEYYEIFDPMYDHHKKSIWNLAVIKTCQLYRHYSFEGNTTYKESLRGNAIRNFYDGYKGSYLRGIWAHRPLDRDDVGLIYWTYWYLGIGGYSFPDAAAKILFKDDTPGHIINPDGLFSRSYVFEQFHTEKPDFTTYGHEIGTNDAWDFDVNADDWEFSCGLFPVLAKI